MREEQTLEQQIAYYRARAGEYDEWFLRQGRFDRGAEANARWFAEAAEIGAALDAFRPAGRVLELACGTGLWTGRLERGEEVETVVAVDAAPEVLAINRQRVGAEKVSYRQGDIFAWQPESEERFNTIFFSFWLSHVPPARFESFWASIRGWLAPGGRVFFLDSRREPTSTATDHVLPAPEVSTMQRRLNDGRTFEIYKIFYEPDALAARLRALGWRAEVGATAHYFLHGSALPEGG